MANPSRPNSVPEGEPSVVVQVKQKHVERLCANQEKIRSFFSVELEPLRGADCSSLVASYKVVPVVNNNSVRKEDVDAPEESAVLATAATGHESVEDLAKRVQHYLDQVCVTEAEDSSYDSDCETDDTNHEQVSRTTSDTLGQEFAEYVSCGGGSQGISQASTAASQAGKCQQSAKSSSASQFPCHMLPVANSGPGYTSRLEFALKLGYTERLVQAALHRLGPNPTQNELLAELIKLGAQQLPCPAGTGTSKLNCDYVCDGLLSECPALSALGCSQEVTCGGEDAVVAGASCASSTSSSSCGEVLRPIVIDGSNVAMSHGNKQAFSCRGIKLCVDWFRNRGHKDIVVFVPKWRKESCSLDNPIKDQEILTELEREGIMVFTPSRFVGGKRMVCYDDRYILKLAAQNEGIVVSNDNYRDLAQDSEFKKVVEDRILMYSFVSDRFMPPDDPLGRSGPTLDNFLRNQPKKGDLPPPCPYGKKCTYGTKCKFNHPERGSGPHKSVSERLSEHAQRHLSARNAIDQHARTPLQGKSLSVPLNAASGDQCLGIGQGTTSSGGESLRKALCRTRSNVVTAETNSHYGPPFPSTPYGPCQQLQPLPSSGLCNRLPAWPPVGDPQGFPKSHSVENLPCENVPTFSIPSSPSQHQLGAQPASNYNQQRSVWPGRSSSNVSPSGMHGAEDADGVNLHRKLQRQLTLNPGGCDPRIYQIQRGMCGPQSQVSGPAPHSPHRPLEPSRSSHCGGTLWEMQQQQQPHQPHAQHQNVTRIASAPDSSRPWHGGPPPASSSEPQINLWPPQHPVHMPSQQQQQQQLQEQRRRLHYHLASIFPEEQVQTVMQMYPDETNPQKICAAILSMFQKI